MSSSFLSNLPFLLNTETAVSQYGAELTALPDGRFVATWLDNSEFFTDGSYASIRMQIFDADGRKTGPETIIREYRVGEQESLPTTPEILGLDDGGFAITWSHQVSLLIADTIQTQVFDSSGAPRSGISEIGGPEIAQGATDIETVQLSNGNLFVVWTAFNSKLADPDSSQASAMLGQHLDASGNPVGDTIVLQVLPNGDGFVEPSTTVLSDDKYVISWTVPSGGSLEGEVVAQIYNPDGTVFLEEFNLASNTDGKQTDVEVVALADGGFVAVWYEENVIPFVESSYVSARVFSADGTPVADSFIVNSDDFTYRQTNPKVTPLPDGGFVVTWIDERDSYENDLSWPALKAQAFDAAGVATSDEHTVTDHVDGLYLTQYNVREYGLTTLPDGRVVVSWDDTTATLEDDSFIASHARILDLTEVVDAGSGGYAWQYRFVSEDGGAATGWSVSSAGDVDGDGRADILIGAPDAGNGAVGEAFLVTGADLAAADAADGAEDGVIETGNIAAQSGSYRFVGTEGQAAVGYSVSSAGDVDGDGLADLLIGVPYTGGSDAGATYLVSGADLAEADAADNSIDGTIDVGNIAAQLGSFSIVGADAGGNAGLSVSHAGDVDGDGLTDLLVANPFANAGSAYLLSGADLAAADAAGGALNGIIGVGDIAGHTGSYRFVGADTDDGFGFSVSAAGDVDGDGLSDLLVGAPNADGIGNVVGGTGEAFLVSGADLAAADAADGTTDGVISAGNIAGHTGSYRFIGGNGNDNAGVSVSSAGDVDGDGRADILVNAVYADGVGNAVGDAGEVFLVNSSDLAAADAVDGVVDGIVDLDNIAGQSLSYRFVGTEQSDWTGWSVSSAGDIDGDGLDDILIGAIGADGVDNTEEAVGETFLVSGADLAAADAADGSADGVIRTDNIAGHTGSFRFVNSDAGDWLGYSVSSAGDVDGDELGDFLIGAPEADGRTNDEDASGEVFLLSGADLATADAADGASDGIIDLARKNAQFLNLGLDAGEESTLIVRGSVTAVAAERLSSISDVEENGSITDAQETGIVAGVASYVSAGIVDIDQFTAAGLGADTDFFKVSVNAGQTIKVTADALGSFDPSVSIWTADGIEVAFNDEAFVSPTVTQQGDSYLEYVAAVSGDYYVSLQNWDVITADPFDTESGVSIFGDNVDGAAILEIETSLADVDYYTFDLSGGDVFGAAVEGFGTSLQIYDPDGQLLQFSSFNSETLYSTNSVLPGHAGHNATAAIVASTSGTYSVAVTGSASGAYELTTSVNRPGLESQGERNVQYIYLDFDGADIDSALFGGSPGTVSLSGLSAFLAGWGLSATDEDAVIDAIIANYTHLVSDSIANGANGDFDTSGISGEFDVEILNSRDHADVWGLDNVTRIVVGGTIAELGIETLGIAESIDVGNFATEETGIVLLDLLSDPDTSSPNSVNSLILDASVSKVDAVGAVVGSIAAHETGHLLGVYHSDGSNDVLNLEDEGGFFLYPVGDDGIFGSADDPEFVFGEDVRTIREGGSGIQDAPATVAYGLSTGAGAGFAYDILANTFYYTGSDLADVIRLAAGAAGAVIGTTSSSSLVKTAPDITGTILIETGDGSDIISVGAGIDHALQINAGDGNDIIGSGNGADVLNGGDDEDTVSYENAAVGVIADLENSNNNTESASGDQYLSIENLRGSRFDDGLTGDNTANRLEGLAGDDLLEGDSGHARDHYDTQAFRMYQAALDRQPDDGGLEFWASSLLNGTETLLTMADGFVTSTEFVTTYGALDNSQFVNQLYNNVLDRDADTGGLAFWLNELAAGSSRAEVIVGFSESREFIANTQETNATFLSSGVPIALTDDIYRMYHATLDRDPDAPGLFGWLTSLGDGTTKQQVADGFVSSSEFQSVYGTLDDTQFVNLLYNNVLDRDADAGGLTFWLDEIGTGTTRAGVVLGFSDSLEFVDATQAGANAWVRSVDLGNDVLFGGAGDDRMFGGTGADTFVFDASLDGVDFVGDLERWDSLVFNDFNYITKEDALAHVTQVGTDAVFSDQGNTVTFYNTTVADLDHADMFSFDDTSLLS